MSVLRDQAIVRFGRPETTWTVLALGMTGTINACSLLPGWHSLFDSNYGWCLLVEVGLVLAMIALGGLNRLRFLPTEDALRMRRCVVVECVLAAAVFLATGVLGLLAPAAR